MAAREHARAGRRAGPGLVAGAPHARPGGWRHDRHDVARDDLRRPRRRSAGSRAPGCSCCATTSPTRRQWKLFLTGFLEPVFYLFSIGIGVGKLIHAFELNGHSIPYAEFVAPGHARGVGVQRRPARLDLQRLLQAQVREALRPDAGHAADDHRHRARRDPLGPAAGRVVLRGLPAGDVGDGAGPLVVGGAGASRRRC